MRAERWLREHADAMYAYAVMRLGRAGDAEDCVQEALLAAIQADDFRGEAAERTWLIGICRHKVLDCLRRRARESAWGDRVRAETDAEEGAFRGGSWAVAQEPWEGARLEGEAARRELAEAIAALPEAMRTALCLREIDGMSTEKTCDLMAISPTNLWTLVHRAKVRLREALGDAAHRGASPDR